MGHSEAFRFPRKTGQPALFKTPLNYSRVAAGGYGGQG